MSILERINSSEDIKKLAPGELDALCAEIRALEIETVSKRGGHLASNLGAVELTVALHRVYDSSRDRILFDVGHQCYAHKIIPGRREAFATLRTLGGVSGFPKPRESADDAFIAGHASDSVSVALGMAHARTLMGETHDVCAVIGDGAMTGGLAYEGLCSAAMSGEPLVIILNDNNMSIDKNVGGTARLLQSMRIKPGYLSFKRAYRKVFSRLPALYRFNHRLKEWAKSHLIPNNVFSEMGFYYLGPVDGHDLRSLETAIRWARDMRVPVLVHVITKKGKGFEFAERDPERYHGVGGFDPVSGEIKPEGDSFSSRFGSALCALAEEDGRITAITVAMAGGTGLAEFAVRFPKRFFDAGIAEGHAAAMAGGMAKQGLIPVFAVYSSFLQRSFDMLIHDVALQRLHAVFAVDRAGIVGRDGETHQGVFDLSYLSSVPGMKLYAPSSFAELESMLRSAVLSDDGPAAIRYPRGGEGAYAECRCEDECVLREGSDLTIVSYGIMINDALEAAAALEEKGVSAEVVKLGLLCPNSLETTVASVEKTGRLIVIEDVCAASCMGQRILAAASARAELKGFRLLNLGDGVVPQGSVDELKALYGVDAAAALRAAEELMGRE